MKTMRPALLFALYVAQAWVAVAVREETNPLQKVLQMLSKMQQDIIKDGEEQHHAYVEFSTMCEDRARELQHETKIATAEVEDLKATINKANDDEGEADSQIEDLSSSLSMGESDLKAATLIRKKEAAEFGENQKDLLDTISQMDRAISIIEKHLNGGASFAQMGASSDSEEQRAVALTQALSAIVDASFISSADASSLAALMQTSEDESDGDAQLDAAAESYGSTQQGDKNSASIVETLQNLLEKAQTSLQQARAKESKSSQNFELFKASLERKIEVDTKDMNDVKKEKAEAGQTRAEAEGDLEVVQKNLEEDKKGLSELHHECMTRAADFEDETKSRDEELKALATAKKILQEMTGDAKEAAYLQVSFLQARSRDSSAPTSSTMEVVQMVQHLGQSQKLPSLVQLAHKMDSVIRTSMVSGVDPFKKVKDMISTMLSKLVKQMEEETSHKVYCDKEMSETKKHQGIKEALEEKLTTKIDTQTSRSMNLKRQVAELQKELLANSKTQKDMDSMRQEEHAVFEKTKPELEQGLEGVKKALKVLREYYSQDEDKPQAKGGAGGGVISMLEVIESDFSKGLASLVAQEETSQGEYEAQTAENQKAKAIKEKDVVFKTTERKGLDKSTSESSADLDGVQNELDAINEYYAKIQEECVAKPDSYEERRKRQQQTLQGLQDAAQILEGKAALIQGSRRMRGTFLHGS